MSKYERNYIKWYLYDNKNKFVLTLGILFLVMPLVALLFPAVNNEEMQITPLVIQNMVVGISVIALAFGMAVYNFRYLMKKGSVVMHMAMPIKKSHLFMINYVLGAMVVSILPLLMYALSIFIEEGTRVQLGLFLIVGLSVSLVGIALYTFYVFLVVKCNNLWDACLICLAYTILPLVLVIGVENMVSASLGANIVSINYQVSELFSFELVLQFFSPVAVIFAFGAGLNDMLFYTQRGSNSNVGLWDLTNKVEQVNFAYVGYWLILGIAFFLMAKHIHEKRKSEASEQRTTAYLCYPFLSLLVASSFLLATTYTNTFAGNMDIQLPISMIAVSFILYLVMNFFAKRKIQITKSMMFSFIGVVGMVYVLNYACITTGAFNLIKEYPVLASVNGVQMTMQIDPITYTENTLSFDFDNPRYERLDDAHLININVAKYLEDKDVIKEVYELQKTLVEEYDSNNYLGNEIFKGSIIIRYEMNNHKQMQREYGLFDQKHLDTVKELFEKLVDKGYCGPVEELEGNIYNHIQEVR